MARIRTIKPDFWSDYRLASDLNRDQRLLYIALWNEADDEGRFLAHPRRLLGACFPYDDDLSESFIEASLRTLVQTHRLLLYEVNGEPYGQLTKFAEHQRINRPTPSKIPGPDNDLGVLTDDSVSPHVSVTEPSQPGAHAREVEQGTGNREMEQGTDTSVGAGAPADPDPAAVVFEHWKEASGHKKARYTTDRKRKISARLGSYTADQLCAAIDKACSNPFYRGDNERGERYDWIETILKNDAAVDRHLAYEPERNGSSRRTPQQYSYPKPTEGPVKWKR